MKIEELRDRNFKTIGTLRDDGRRVELRDATFRTLGWYDKQSNTTTDASFRRVGTGNLLTSLLNR
jgi:hypothetical protein